jgi:hypothetical protein
MDIHIRTIHLPQGTQRWLYHVPLGEGEGEGRGGEGLDPVVAPYSVVAPCPVVAAPNPKDRGVGIPLPSPPPDWSGTGREHL